MNLRHILSLSAISAVGLAWLPTSAVSQQKSLKDQLAGARTLVSIENTAADGKKVRPFGPNLKGILVFDASGRYVQAQARAERANFKSGNRMQVSADESAAAIRDTLAIFGTWSVDEAGKTIVLRVESHTIPNTQGTETKRMVTSITADELQFTNPTTGLGGTNVSVYRRVK